MRKLSCLITLFLAIPTSAAEIVVLGFNDASVLQKSNQAVSIYLDGMSVVHSQNLPVVLQTNANKTDITICIDTTAYCDSATIFPENEKSTEVGFLTQKFLGALGIKVLTGGGLKVVENRIAAQDARKRP